MFKNIQDNRHFRKLLTKQKYSSVVTKIKGLIYYNGQMERKKLIKDLKECACGMIPLNNI